jgi:hypothetical protein
MAEEGIARMLREMRGDRKIFQGDHITIVGVMTGTKSENGWRYELSESRSTD